MSVLYDAANMFTFIVKFVVYNTVEVSLRRIRNWKKSFHFYAEIMLY